MYHAPHLRYQLFRQSVAARSGIAVKGAALLQAFLFYTWWRYQMETFSTLMALCAKNSLVTGVFPSQRPVTRSFDVFFDMHLHKQLSKQSRRWWFETPMRSSWRHCNDVISGWGVSLKSTVMHLDGFLYTCGVKSDKLQFNSTLNYSWSWNNGICMRCMPSHVKYSFATIYAFRAMQQATGSHLLCQFRRLDIITPLGLMADLANNGTSRNCH